MNDLQNVEDLDESVWADFMPDVETWAAAPVKHFNSLLLAERFAKEYGHDLRWCSAWNSWLVWDGVRWGVDSAGADLIFGAFMKQVLAEEEEALAADPKSKMQWLRVQSASAFMNYGSMQSCLKSTRPLPGISVDTSKLDTHTWLLGVGNGVIDLKTGELRDGRREDLLTQHIATKYDPDAQSVEWDQFIWNITLGDVELAKYLQKIAGIILTGDTSHQKVFFLYGHGANGKSTFVDTLMALMGSMGKVMPEGMVTKAKKDPEQWQLAELFGARLLLATEVDENAKIAEDVLKRLASTEPITGARKYGQPFTFRLSAVTLATMNHKPFIQGVDQGIWRRIALVPFLADFNGNKDESLPGRLMQHLDAVLAWAVKGALLFKAEGLTEPTMVKEATTKYRVEMDTLGRFLDEVTVKEAGTRVSGKTAFDAYQAWCRENGHVPGSSSTFGRRLADRGYEKVRSNGIHYVGLRLKTLQEGHEASDGGDRSLEQVQQRVDLDKVLERITKAPF